MDIPEYKHRYFTCQIDRLDKPKEKKKIRAIPQHFPFLFNLSTN